MRRGHEDLFNEIFLQRLHALDSLAAPVLAPEIIHGHTLDIAKVRHGDDRVADRNEILHADIKFIIADLCPAVVSIFIRNEQNLLPDYSQKFFLVCKDFF